MTTWVGTSWKMNKTLDQARDYARTLAATDPGRWQGVQPFVIPPATALATVNEVLGHGSGVCQDFAHVTLALLRAMGIPSWYVSGYLHPNAEAEIDERAVGESHAWVAAFTGTVWPLDPTSMHPVAERHVRVAAGRDYHDVAPFRGIYAGRAEQALEVSVELVRTA